MSFKDYDKTTRPQVANEDLEQSKFKKTASNKVAVRVGNEADDPLHVVTEGVIQFDYISVTYPNSTSEVYAYYIGGAGGNLVATVTVTYYDTGKRKIKNVSKV